MLDNVKILLASSNLKKLRELSAQLRDVDVQIVTPQEVGGIPDVVEDGSTFRANAQKKAIAAARHVGVWSLADDSGLEVDALGGAPGIHSARFAGTHGDDAANNALLLERLRGVPDELRTARFVCALALARPDGSVALEVEGVTRGRILHSPRGKHDFGYDPLFSFDEPGFAESGRGFAELELEEKARVSHRGRALRALAARLPLVMPASGRGPIRD
jgi:XTP/dITP diphosphohydrolase